VGVAESNSDSSHTRIVLEVELVYSVLGLLKTNECDWVNQECWCECGRGSGLRFRGAGSSLLLTCDILSTMTVRTLRDIDADGLVSKGRCVEIGVQGLHPR
jgi:hypothetical protein